MSSDTPITTSNLVKILPLAVSAGVALAVSAFGWGVTYATLDGRVTRLEQDVPRVEQLASQPAQEARLIRIEALVAELVCLDQRANQDLCRRALGGAR